MPISEQSAKVLADFADLVLNVAREIRLQIDEGEGVIPLTPSEGNVMRFIDRDPGCSAKTAADGAGLRRSNLSAAVRGLEAKGLVLRETHPDDRREVLLYPTPLAEKNLLRLRSLWSERLNDALAADPTHDVPAAVRLLTSLELNFARTRQRVAGPHE